MKLVNKNKNNRQSRNSNINSTSNQRNSIPDNHRKSLLSDRLSHIVVFELLAANSNSSNPPPPGTLRNMRLRDLYSYILEKIKKPHPAAEGSNPTSKTSKSPTRPPPPVPPSPSLFSLPLTSFPPAPVPPSPPHQLLGGPLHPRDMRRMVTPFSATNPPNLIIRRHVMLLNFDPLRAIVLKDRLLLLVPDGADSILSNLEKSVRGGLAGKEDEVFGGPSEANYQNDELSNREDDDSEVAFELVCLDSVLQAACVILQSDFVVLSKQVNETMEELRGSTTGKRKKRSMARSQEGLRVLKNEISILESRVGGFQAALDAVLDEDEDLALMNLSRLVSDPGRFVQPVSREVLEEEGDEPELILEAYSQQSLNTVNSLNLLKSQVAATEQLVLMSLDRVRNRLLAYNTILSLIAVCVGTASLVGSFFGMNLVNHLEQGETAWENVVIWTCVGVGTVGAAVGFGFYKMGVM
ncbi:hypothetical protein TrVE_jg4880 [Triparma verrucosa]|nr:hypothetical protein TrVE_jg4880 [Triparma verrucosa]